MIISPKSLIGHYHNITDTNITVINITDTNITVINITDTIGSFSMNFCIDLVS